MSTRYIKRDNVRILGLAKNASQALKQVALQNENDVLITKPSIFRKLFFIRW